MKNSEAISKIRFMLDVGGNDGFSASDKEALNMAINALSLHDEPKSNADKIRAMDDEELAEWFAPHMMCKECERRVKSYGCDKGECTKYALIYMKKEVSEDAGID